VKIYRDLDTVEANDVVATIGIFDGVHIGHKFLLDELKRVARERGKESLVITFWPHPRVVLQKEGADKLRFLTTIQEKIILLEKHGIDNLFIIPFNRQFASLGACEFVEKYLVNKLNINHLIVGHNHSFGKNGEGNFETLSDCAEKYGFTISKLGSKNLNERKISSTIIRNCLLDGNTELAADLLGYNYCLSGTIVKGRQLGREISFPTANLLLNHPFKLVPKSGVYGVSVDLDGNRYFGMMNIGTRPTIEGDDSLSIEVHLFNFDADVYGHNIAVNLHFYVREEMKFENINELKLQLENDKEFVLSRFA